MNTSTTETIIVPDIEYIIGFYNTEDLQSVVQIQPVSEQLVEDDVCV